MGYFFGKQPNGLYYRFSTVVDTLTHINLTKEDVINMFIENAKEEANIAINKGYGIEDAIDLFIPNVDSEEIFNDKIEKTKIKQKK